MTMSSRHAVLLLTLLGCQYRPALCETSQLRSPSQRQQKRHEERRDGVARAQSVRCVPGGAAELNICSVCASAPECNADNSCDGEGERCIAFAGWLCADCPEMTLPGARSSQPELQSGQPKQQQQQKKKKQQKQKLKQKRQKRQKKKQTQKKVNDDGSAQPIERNPKPSPDVEAVPEEERGSNEEENGIDDGRHRGRCLHPQTTFAPVTMCVCNGPECKKCTEDADCSEVAGEGCVDLETLCDVDLLGAERPLHQSDARDDDDRGIKFGAPGGGPGAPGRMPARPQYRCVPAGDTDTKLGPEACGNRPDCVYDGDGAKCGEGEICDYRQECITPEPFQHNINPLGEARSANLHHRNRDDR